MERNNGRYIHNRRQSNNNQHLDNHHQSHHNNSSQYSTPPTSLSSYSSQNSNLSREPLTQHDELIRYIREAWTNVREQGSPVVNGTESDQLKNFKPFNLEEYWGQRHIQNIQISQGHQ